MERQLSSFIFLHRRAVAQRCPSPPMLNLISVGGQHQGSVLLSYLTSLKGGGLLLAGGMIFFFPLSKI